MHAADLSVPDGSLPRCDAPTRSLRVLAERLSRTLAVARALALAGRHVDLTGIEDGVGLLCAKTLDLDRPDARVMLPSLFELVAQIDSLRSLLAAPAPAH